MPLVDDWIAFFTDATQSENLLKNDYGVDYHNFKVKQKTILQLLNLHKKKFGNEDIIIVRAPGRINLMGRHVDHQNGLVNLIAIDKEIFFTASIRKDFKLVAYNIDTGNFPDLTINFSNLSFESLSNWSDVIKNTKFLNKYRSPGGSWDNYLKAAYLRLSNLYGLKKVHGANICVLGNILIAAGLSSSSALTVGIFKALSELNKLNFNEDEMISRCAEAEWFVGTRGGTGDQVAIIFAKKNQIAHVKLFPLEILDWIEFPNDCELLIYNSQVLADKSGARKDVFNERILAYDIGFYLIKKKFPQFSSRLVYLSDINPKNLEITSSDLINILSELPEYVHFNELPKVLGKKWDPLKKKFNFNEIPQIIPIRKIIAYGISECERSRVFYHLIKKRDINHVGKLMYISHNGDRVVRYNYDEKPKPTRYNNEMDENQIKADIESNMSIDHISGGYGCSIPEIDFIIDTSQKLGGVLGAQLSGAGMGGCAMLFVKKGYSEKIKNELCKLFEVEFKKRCLIQSCVPVKGISLFNHIK